MFRFVWVLVLGAAIAGCSSSSGSPSAPVGPSVPGSPATAVPSTAPSLAPGASPTPVPSAAPTAVPTATPVPTSTPALPNAAGSITAPANGNFPYGIAITYGPNNAPVGNGNTLASFCAVNSATELGTGNGQCNDGGATNVAGTLVWIAVTWEPGITGTIVFGPDTTASTLSSFPAGTYTADTYLGHTLIATTPATVAGGTLSFATPFANTTINENAIYTIEIAP